MAKIVRARYENGVLKPLEKIDLEEGEELGIIRCEEELQRFFARRLVVHRGNRSQYRRGVHPRKEVATAMRSTLPIVIDVGVFVSI